MFGLSFSELLLIAIPLAFLWISIKRDRDDEARRENPTPPSVPEAEDMTACAVCGAYRPAVSREPCEREDCPFS